MPLVRPGLFHRLGLVVEDVEVVDSWYRRVLGSAPVKGTERPRRDPAEPDAIALEGASTKMLWQGRLPILLLGAADPSGAVARFMARWGPGMHSVAWEIDDMWTVEHLLVQSGYRITGVNVPGRHFFMHPADTDGVLIEWTDTSISGDPRRGEPEPAEEAGVVGGVNGVAWITAVVADSDAVARRLTEVAAAQPVVGNPFPDEAHERAVDVRVGDVTMRLVTPFSSASRHMAVLERGARLWSYTISVRDLDAALVGLAAEGVETIGRSEGVAWTDPATTFGIPMEWTEAGQLRGADPVR